MFKDNIEIVNHRCICPRTHILRKGKNYYEEEIVFLISRLSAETRYMIYGILIKLRG